MKLFAAQFFLDHTLDDLIPMTHVPEIGAETPYTRKLEP